MDISGVKNGIVIDHIKAGKSMQIYDLLGLGKIDNTVALIKNASSAKYGKKDIIKIDAMIDLNMDLLGYVDPNITVNFVKDGVLISKRHLELPIMLSGVLTCKNPRCITGVEQGIVHRFQLSDPENRIYRCVYCDVEHREY